MASNPIKATFTQPEVEQRPPGTVTVEIPEAYARDLAAPGGTYVHVWVRQAVVDALNPANADHQPASPGAAAQYEAPQYAARMVHGLPYIAPTRVADTGDHFKLGDRVYEVIARAAGGHPLIGPNTGRKGRRLMLQEVQQ